MIVLFLFGDSCRQGRHPTFEMTGVEELTVASGTCVLINPMPISFAAFGVDEHAAEQRWNGHVQRHVVCRRPNVAENLHGGQH